MTDAKSVTSVTSSGKRKRSTPLAFYAVKVGRTPGIYQTWNEANQQVQGFPNPIYKKFASFTEAEAMMKGGSSSATKSGKTKYYGVAVGHAPGVYTDYATVQAQTKGCVGAKQKAFATRVEAQAYVDAFWRGASAPISLRGDVSETSSSAVGKVGKISEVTNKRQKKQNAQPPTALTNGHVEYEPGLGPLPPDAEDGFDRTIKLDIETGNIRHKTDKELRATKSQQTGDFSGPIVVYTDGSSLGNGRVGAVAGVGVYFGPKDPRNVSEPLRGDRQTNQRAELTAVARALDHVPIDREVLIVTDSNYAIKCLTEWFPKWEQKGWKNSQGKPVENRDLIEPIIARVRERDVCKAKTKFKWIKGHANDPGNVAADGLAVNGSRLSTPELRSAREISVTLNTPTRSRYTPESIKELLARQPSAPANDNDEDFDEIFASLAAEQSVNQAERAPASDIPINPDTQAGEASLEHILDNDSSAQSAPDGENTGTTPSQPGR